MTDRCTCQPGRDHDGSEFGPCAWCESKADRERLDALLHDQCPGLDDLEDGAWPADPGAVPNAESVRRRAPEGSSDAFLKVSAAIGIYEITRSRPVTGATEADYRAAVGERDEDARERMFNELTDLNITDLHAIADALAGSPPPDREIQQAVARLRKALDDADTDQADFEERGENPGVWEGEVEVLAADLRLVLSAPLSATNILRTLTSEGAEEALARVIDPEAWAKLDKERAAPTHNHKNKQPWVWEEYYRRCCERSCVLARAVISHLLAQAIGEG